MPDVGNETKLANSYVFAFSFGHEEDDDDGEWVTVKHTSDTPLPLAQEPTQEAAPSQSTEAAPEPEALIPSLVPLPVSTPAPSQSPLPVTMATPAAAPDPFDMLPLPLATATATRSDPFDMRPFDQVDCDPFGADPFADLSSSTASAQPPPLIPSFFTQFEVSRPESNSASTLVETSVEPTDSVNSAPCKFLFIPLQFIVIVAEVFVN